MGRSNCFNFSIHQLLGRKSLDMATNKEHGINANNQEFNKYEQVQKDQSYKLVENETEDPFDEEFKISTCDIGLFLHGDAQDRKTFSQQLGKAMETIGFVILEGHGIDASIYAEGEAKVQEIFEEISLEERMKFEAKRFGSVNQGYFPIKETTIIHPDLVEGWVFCRRAFDLGGENFKVSDFWPEGDFEPFFRKMVEQHEALFLPIMQSILTYLGCDAHLYDQKLSGTNFGFRLNYYPPLKEEDLASGAGRMLGHEDVDLFTILPAQSVDGLQVLNHANNKWIRLNPPKGSIILNTGDYMQRITNDRLPSTTHRVSKPQQELFGKPRITFPTAVYVWENELLEVLPCCGKPKYEPIRAEDFHTRITSKYYGDKYADK